MRKITRNRKSAALAMVAAASTIALTQQAFAASYWWDINGTNTGANGTTTTATGLWDTTTANWTTDTNGSSATVAWSAGNTAIFSAGTNVSGNFTVTIGAVTIPGIAGITTEEGGTITFAGSAGSNLSFAGAPTLNLSKNIVINSGVTLTGTGGFTKASGGTLTIGSDNSGTLTGQIKLNGGTVALTNGGGLGASGTGNEVIFGNTGASLTLSGGINVNKNATLDGGASTATSGQILNSSGSNTWSGNILINGAGGGFPGATTVGVGAASGTTLTITGSIQNASGNTQNWVKTGDGAVVLLGNNTFTGLTRVAAGQLIIEADHTLGVPSSGPTDSGAFNHIVIENTGGDANLVAFKAPASAPGGFLFSDYHVISLINTGRIGTAGNLDNFGGNNTYAGDIEFNGGSYIGVSAGSLTLAGDIWRAGPSGNVLNKVESGNLILTGDNGHVTTIPGTLLVMDQWGDPSQAEGVVNIQQGALTLAGNGTVGYVQMNVSAGATFAIDNSTTAVANRFVWGSNTPSNGNPQVILNSSRFAFTGNSSTATSYDLSTIKFSGNSYIAISSPGAATALNLGSITRDNHQTLVLQGVGAANTAMSSSATTVGGGGSAGTTTISIIPWMVGDASLTGTGTDFVTIDPSTSTVRMLAAGEYADFSTATTNSNALLSGNQTVSSNLSINALKIGGATGSTLTINTGNTLSTNASAFLDIAPGSSTITGGTLSMANEGIFNVVSGSSMTIASSVVANNGLTKVGLGTVNLMSSSGLNGTIVVNEGSLLMGALNASQAIINGGTLQADTLSSGTSVNLGQGILRLTQSQSTGATLNIIDTLGSPSLDLPNAGESVTFTGGIKNGVAGTPVVGWFKSGPGTLYLQDGAYDVSVNLSVSGGMVSMDQDSRLGNSAFASGGFINLVTGGAIQYTQNTNILHSIILNTNSTTAGIDIPTGVTVEYGDGLPFETQTISGTGVLVKTGGGTLAMEAQATQNSNSGGTRILGGTLQFDDWHGEGTASAHNNKYYEIGDGATLAINQGAAGGWGDFANVNRAITVDGNSTLSVGLDSQQSVPVILNLRGGIYDGGGATEVFHKTGVSTVVVETNSTTPTYKGKYSIDQGTYLVSSDAALGAVPASATPDSITIADGATFGGGFTNEVTTTTTGVSSFVGFVTNANRGITLASGNATINVNDYLYSSTAAGATITGAAVTVTFGGQITGNANLIVNGTGTTAFSGTGSNFVGDVYLNGGPTQLSGQYLLSTAAALPINGTPTVGTTTAANTLQIAKAGTLPSTSMLYFNTGGAGTGYTATLDLTGGGQTFAGIINSLPGSGLPTITGSSNTLRNFGINNTVDDTWDGNMTGSINFTKTGSGAFVLAVNPQGNVINYAGNTTVGGGTLNISANNMLPTTTGLTVNGTGLFDLQNYNQTVASFTLQGGTMAGSVGGVLTSNSLTVQTGAASVILAGTGGLTKSSTGTVTLTGVNTYTGNNTINGGTLIAGAGNLGSTSNNLVMGGGTLSLVNSVTVGNLSGTSGLINTNGNTLTVNQSGNTTYGGGFGPLANVTKNLGGNLTVANFRGNSLTINAGKVSVAIGGGTAGTSTLNGLSIDPSAALDLGDHSLVVNYTGSSPIATIRSQIASGYAGGAWNGNGINSAAAASDTNFRTALGYAEASQLGLANGGAFGGQTVAGNAVLVKYTYNGDNDLDGKVTLNDFSIFVDGFNGLGSGWVFGDYNYDNHVDGTDLSLFVDAYKNQGGSLSALDSAILSNPDLSNAQKNAMLNVVPEPGTLSLLAIGAGVMGLRRRRKA